MAISKTKYELSYEEILSIVNKLNKGELIEYHLLGNGEFNAAYKLVLETGAYVLKVSPKGGSKTMTYENHMMESEVYWYKKMKGTNILIPNVLLEDFSRSIIDGGYFIMDFIEGCPLYEANLSKDDYKKVIKTKLFYLSEIHRIKGEGFGYLQLGLENNWYLAIKKMVNSLIKDCEAMGYHTPNGYELLESIAKHKSLLEKQECRMVNFDLWDSNIMYSNGNLYWIDPERSFYGDPICDFIPVGKGQKVRLSEKLEELAIYNEFAEKKLIYDEELEIRYQIAVGYLALIEEVEKYNRYEPTHENYIRNTIDAEDMFNMAFSIL